MAVAIRGTKDKAKEVNAIKRELLYTGRGEWLNHRLDKELLKKVIEAVTVVNEVAARELQRRINKKVTSMLSDFVPASLLNAYRKHPEAFTPHPGFLFTCTQVYGSHTMWATPSLPVYLPQFSEMDALRERKPAETEQTEVLVGQWMARQERVAAEQAKLANAFASCGTQLALLNYDPAMWRIYVQLMQESDKARAALRDRMKKDKQKKNEISKRKAAAAAEVRRKLAEDEKNRAFKGTE